MIILGIILAGVFSCIGLFLGPKLKGEAKEIPFESGFLRDGMEGHRYDVKFYMTALVFLIFDVEVIFLYPSAVQIGERGWFGFNASLLFLGILIIGLAYDWKKGALEWE